MFDGIASRYDFLNHFLSCYQDVLWRRYCCKRLKKMMAAGMLAEKSIGEMPRDLNKVRLLDLCGGTGDFANTFRKIFESGCKCGSVCKCVSQNGVSRDFVVDPAVIGDFSYGMLAEVKPKKIDAHAVQLDAMKMPFGDASFDVILNGFGMRNLPDAELGLKESARVLCGGGYLQVLEFFSPRNAFNKFFYRRLAPLFIPVLGAFFSKREAYEYLVNSVLRFLPVADFVALAESNGFELVHVKPCFFGVAYRVLLRRRS